MFSANLPFSRIRAPYFVLGFLLLLGICAYFLSANGRINNFPTYLIALIVLAILLLSRPLTLALSRLRIIRTSALLLIYLAISTLWSETFSLREVLVSFADAFLLLSFLCAVIICNDVYEKFTPLLISIVILAASVSAVYSMTLYLSLNNNPLPEDRLYALGRLHNPVVSALSYGIASVFAFCNFLSTTDPYKRLGWLILLGFLLSTIYLTGSKGVLIGLTSVAVLSTSLQLGLSRKQTIVFFGILLGTISLILITLYLEFAATFGVLFPRAASFRPEIWLTVMESTFEHNLLFGFGYLATGSISTDNMEFMHAHSIYLATFYYGGLIGLTLLIYVITIVFKETCRANSTDLHTIVLSSFLFAITTLIVDGDRLLLKIDYIWLVFWLPIALATIIEHNQKKQTTLHVH
jgi:hypothetical protein